MPLAPGSRRRASQPAGSGNTARTRTHQLSRKHRLRKHRLRKHPAADEKASNPMPILTYPEAMFVGLLQGVTALFPVSSLGHSVLIPAIIGGSWGQDPSVSRPETPHPAFIVGLPLSTPPAPGCSFWRGPGPGTLAPLGS